MYTNYGQNKKQTEIAGHAMACIDGVWIDVDTFVQEWHEWTEEFVEICHELMRLADSAEEDILQAHYNCVVAAATMEVA